MNDQEGVAHDHQALFRAAEQLQWDPHHRKRDPRAVYITVNGEGDGVFMDTEAFEKQEQLLNLRARILQAEEDRLRGTKTMSISEAREALRKL